MSKALPPSTPSSAPTPSDPLRAAEANSIRREKKEQENWATQKQQPEEDEQKAKAQQ